MWGQIGDKEADGAFAVTWHGKAKPSLLFSEKLCQICSST